MREERLRAARVAVERLLEEDRPEEALAVLERLVARHPGWPEVLEELADLSSEMGDLQRYQDALERLRLLRPEDPELAVDVAEAALGNLYPVTALEGFRRFLARWPSHPLASEARQRVEELEGVVREVFRLLGVSGEEAVPVALEHERIQHLLSLGRTGEVREAARALHAAQPQIKAVLNNLGQAEWMEGRLAEAEATFRRVLAEAPDNVHALANLARVLFVSGREEEASEVAERMKVSTAPARERWLKQAETLALLGDDEGVLESFEKAEEEGQHRPAFTEARLRHLAAVAAMRRGDAARAEHLWEEAVELVPGLKEARRNLEALELPVALRPAPWAFGVEGWLPPGRWKALQQRMDSVKGKGREEARREGARLLEAFPELRTLVPVWLERGSPEAVRLALRLGELLWDVSLLEVVKRFALGERGALDERFEAARILLAEGLARQEELWLWTGKRRQPYGWLDLEVSDEPEAKHSRRVTRLLGRALEALEEGEGEEGERLLREALVLEPDAPDLLNNLAMAYQLQGRVRETMELVEEIHRRWPEYLFARTAVARWRIEKGRLEEARELLAPLLERRRLHPSELSALCGAQMELLRAEGDVEGAWVWLHILERYRPEDPQVALYHVLLAPRPGLLGRLKELLGELGAPLV